jgi:hypothetical protein
LDKNSAIRKLDEPTLPLAIAKNDKEFVLKKFGLNENEFDDLMANPRKEHSDFEQEQGFRKSWFIFKLLAKLK